MVSLGRTNEVLGGLDEELNDIYPIPMGHISNIKLDLME